VEIFVLLFKKNSIPVEKDGSFSKCRMYDRNYEQESYDGFSDKDAIVACTHGWDYDYSQYINTVVTEVPKQTIYCYLLSISRDKKVIFALVKK
jgi:hypothetical protein